MKLPMDIVALSTRHSFTGDDPKYTLEATLLGHPIKVHVSPEVVSEIDVYISSVETRAQQPRSNYVEERREYPNTYDPGVEYELGAVSLNDMEDL
jgi:hypothetical protein